MSGAKIMFSLGCALAACANVFAVSPPPPPTVPEDTGNSSNPSGPGTPYQGIVDRNVFALRPPPPPPPPKDDRPPPPKIYMTGITTLFNKKLVLLKVTLPAKPGTKAEEEAYTLGENERQGEIQVLSIDEKNGIVKVDDYGMITNLNWTDNGIKVATPAPQQAAAPAGAPPPNPGPFNPGMPANARGPGNRVVPTNGRQMRTGAGGNAGASNPGYGGTAAPVSVTTPNGSVSLPGLGNQASPIMPTKNWPPEVTNPDTQQILDAAYNLKYQQQIQQGTMPEVPGPGLLDGVNGNGQGQQQNPAQNTLPRAPSTARTLPY
jgi:hypothetical protein